MNFLRYAFILGYLAFSLGLVFLSKPNYNENSLLDELGPPPPWPIFIVINVLADTLRNFADMLTPPQITMLDYGFSHQKLALPYVIQKYKIADFIGNGNGPKTIKQIAAYLQIKNIRYVERFMYSCVSIGLFKLVDQRMFMKITCQM